MRFGKVHDVHVRMCGEPSPLRVASPHNGKSLAWSVGHVCRRGYYVSHVIRLWVGGELSLGDSQGPFVISPTIEERPDKARAIL